MKGSMADIVIISSQVVYGAVGGTAMVRTLRALGHEPLLLPSVIMSNHPGHGRHERMTIPAGTLNAMADVLAQQGRLDGIAAVISGYLADAAQAETVKHVTALVRRRSERAIYCCDPVMGDTPKGLYVAEEIAQAIAEELAPAADIITPNLFELERLAGVSVATADAAIEAAIKLGRPRVMVSSAPGKRKGRISNLLVIETNSFEQDVPYIAGVPHGTGDVLAAALTSNLLRGLDDGEALKAASQLTGRLAKASIGLDELDLSALSARRR
jgi:pyridoxine kinase